MTKQNSTFTSRFLKEYKSYLKSGGMTESIHLRTPNKVRSTWKPLHARKEYGSKDYERTLWLSGFLGMFGADRFYLGYFWMGLFKLLTAGGFMSLYFYDLWRLADSKMLDATGQRLKYERIIIGPVYPLRVFGVAQLFLYTPVIVLVIIITNS
jgi:hypothetical protein